MAGDYHFKKKFPEFYAGDDDIKIQKISTGFGIGSAAMAGGLFAWLKHQENKEVKKNLKKKKEQRKQKQSMTSNKAYSTKFFGHTDHKNK